MNISGFTNIQSYMPKVSSPLVAGVNETEEVSTLVRVFDMAAKRTEDEPFYVYSEGPWLTDPGFEQCKDKEEYLYHKKNIEYLALAATQIGYDRFMKNLADAHPEIAAKKFGFTLDRNAFIKVLDYDDALNEEEKYVLTEALNNFENLKDSLQDRARAFMILADHDLEIFGGRYKLNLDNFQDVIDFGKILGASQKQMQVEWILQIELNAEQRDSAYVSVSA